MGILWQDLSYGVRMLWKSRGVTAVAVVAIALGIGANTAIFSVVNAVLLRPLPFDRPEQLVRIYGTNIKKGVITNPISYLNFLEWRNRSSSFEQMAAYTSAGAALTGTDNPEQLNGVIVSADIFPMLAVKPSLGRTYTSEDEQPGKPDVVIISDSLWQRRFGADRTIVGREIKLGGDNVTVIGVMPPAFKFPITEDNVEFWVPIDATTPINEARGSNYLSVIARLKPGATLAQAQNEMDSVAKQLEAEFPTISSGRGIRAVSMYEATVGNVRPALLVLLGAVGLVLLIACANVANLLLARASGRQKEIALRTALGATRGRLVRQLLTESVLLAGTGGVVGLLLAHWSLSLLVGWIPANVPRAQQISLDWRVLCFTFGISILTGLLFGLAPALAASKLDLTESLNEGGRGGTEGIRRNRVRNLLVISEIALSLMLLIGAGLLIRSFERLREVNPGLNPDRVVTMSIALSESKYKDENQQSQFFQELLARVERLPGVDAAGIVDPLPLSNNMAQNIFTIEGRPPLATADRLIASTRVISPDYLRAMQIPVIRGRALTERDTKDAPKVMLINETLARRFFPDEDPIGKRASVSVSDDFGCEIVGIVGDVKHRSLDAEAGPEFYLSYLQSPIAAVSLVTRTKVEDPTGVVPSIRNVVTQLDSDLPIADVRPMNELLAESVASRRFNMVLLAVFASIALLLAGVGIYGVMTYSVAQRTREIGIRMALGAQARDVLGLIVRQGLYLVVIGVTLGVAGAFAVTRVMASLLYGVSATDPIVFGLVASLLCVIALFACYVPARRATKLDPVNALRSE